MSDVKVIRYLLAHNANLVAQVPAEKIMAGPLPENTVLPAISVMHISTLRRQTLKGGGIEFCTSRVQTTVMAPTYKKLKQIIALARAALPIVRGAVNGVNVDSILSDIEGPDFRNDEIGAFMASLDHIVTFTE